jgi:myo-inositol-1(or 4)-monophosphatase
MTFFRPERDEEEAYCDLLEEVLRETARVHRGQSRNGYEIPFVTHPYQAALVLLQHNFPRHVAGVGMLHALVQDLGYELSDIRLKFGMPVADIVAALSEKKQDDNGHDQPWEVRNMESLDQIRRADAYAVAVKAADALHDARSMVLDVREEGPAVWQRFSQGPGPILDYYRQVTALVSSRLEGHSLAEELEGAVEDLARVVAEAGTDDLLQPVRTSKD